MNKIFSKFSLLIVIGLLSIFLSENYTLAADKIWNGSTSSDWNDGANWDGGSVPPNGGKVLIPTALTNYPSITSGTVTIKDVKIDGTGSLTITGGTFDATGKIEFLATKSPYGTVTQSGGTINVKDLKFTGAGTFNQSGSSLLTVSHDYKNNGGGTFNSIGGTIQFTGSGGGGPDFSTGTNQFFNMIINSGVFPKFSNVTPCKIKVAGNFTNNNSSLDCLTAEFIFNGTSDQTISSACSPVPGSNTFGKLTIDNPGTVTLLTNVEAKIYFTLTQGELVLNGNLLYVNGEEYTGPLPVELVSFSANINDTKVILNWLTATEVNNYGFEIQRSIQTGKWDLIGFVEGHGNSNSVKEYSFIDAEVNSSGIYSYRLKQIDNDGSYEFSNTIEVNFNVPNNFELSQNYPNPFNPSTTISFKLPKSGVVTLKVYNLMGEEIKTLVEGYREVGIYTINFNAEEHPSGMYLYRLSTNSFTETKKMLFMK